MSKLIILFSLVLFCSLSANSQSLYQPLNLDFEEGAPGAMPLGWEIPKKVIQMGYTAFATDDNPAKGKLCVELRFEGDNFQEDFYGSVMQSVDATAYRGKKIKIRAAIRCTPASVGAAAYIWAHERYKNEKSGWMQINEEHPIVLNNWTYTEVTGVIDEQAMFINFGLLLKGNGRAWIDDVSFTVVEDYDYTPLPASPMAEREIKNSLAFIKALGYTQFYYPGFSILNIDWNKFGREGLLKIADAKSDDSLSRIMDRHFKTVAPELQITSSTGILKPYSKPAGALENFLLTWIHAGLGVEDESRNFYSRVINLYETQRDREAAAYQVINVKEHAGKKFTFKADVKVEQANLSGQAQLWVRVDDDKHNALLTLDMFQDPIRSSEWKQYKQEFKIPAGAELLKIGLVFLGEGKAWFDHVQLTADDGSLFLLKNADFEDDAPGPLKKAWVTPQSAYYAGYDFQVVTGEASNRVKSLMISSDPATRIILPTQPETFYSMITDSVRFIMPYTLYIKDAKAAEQKTPYDKDLMTYSLTLNDRASRILIAGMLWNYINNFNMYKIPQAELDAALESALKNAAIAEDNEKFIESLQSLISILNDGSTRVWLEDEFFALGAPFLWELIDGKLYISKKLETEKSVSQGDEVLEINGKPVAEALKNKKAKISGSTEHWKNLRALAELRSSLKEEDLTLKTKSAGEIRNITVKKNMKLYRLKKNDLEPWLQLDSGVYYLDATRVIDKEILALKDTIAEAKAIVIDLRGSTSASEYFLGYFLKDTIKSLTYKIPIYTSPDNKVENYKTINPYISPLSPYSGAKLIFLADENTNGYAESILNVVKRYKLGLIVGRETSGTISEVHPVRLPAKIHASLNVMKIFDEMGEEITRKSLKPDVEVKRELNHIINNEDELLLRAMEIILNNKL